ncbi:hypothetical protein QBC47DRAFT_439520 [Echria macrotheca]|uniref:Uncharacterized protein n=1 Tax=Echria macrotheca TaxID=438768 RepID=A0AAJ0B1A7_9PEZI|nr:hypothetical protein QBC47DRAFT_439520 [Echria macrotheca]
MSSFLKALKANKALLLGTLSVGSQGEAVTLLHTSLLLLWSAQPETQRDKHLPYCGLEVPEIASATYGASTRSAVLEFQRENKASLGSPPSGVVDRDTATVLYNKLLGAGVDPSQPEVLFVAGRVEFADGSSSPELLVAVYDRDLRTETRLVALKVSRDGYFLGRYRRGAYPRSKTRRPTLVPRVELHKEVIYTPTVDQIIYDAAPLALINIALAQRSPAATTTDQFSQVVTALAAAVPPVEEQKDHEYLETADKGKGLDRTGPALPDISSRVRSLREDDKVQDVSYLSRLNPSLFTPQNLTTTILAYRISNVAKTKHQLDLSPELFYGLLATRTAKTFSSRDPSNTGFSQPSLDTSPETLLYQFGLTPVSDISNALTAAKTRNLISANFTISPNLDDLWKRLGDIAGGIIKRLPTTEDNIWDMIADFLSSGKEEAVRAVLEGDNIQGDLLGFFNHQINYAFSTGKTPSQAPQGFAASPKPSIPLPSTRVLLEKLNAGASKSTRELAGTDHEKIRNLLAETPMNEEGELLSDKDAQNATASVLGALEKAFPTEAFKANLRAHINSTPPAVADTRSIAEKPASVRFGHKSLGIDACSVMGFLEDNPHLDLQHDRVSLAGAAPEHGSSTAKSLAKLQRVFKLAPTFAKTQALLDMGIHSASHIARSNRENFVKAVTTAKPPGQNVAAFAAAEGSPTGQAAAFTVDEAHDVFERATNIQLATALVAGDLRSAAGALLPAGISPPLPPAKLDAVTKNFPTLATLFEMGDVCACSDCMTVYSPSAYLVDVLEFLKARAVLESLGGSNNGRTVRDVLLARRPDIADLDLSCANTNTTLPYIDLVCELLEDFVAPDGLSPGSFSGVVDKGKISTALLAFLRDDLQLPFTEDALVSDVYNGGYRTVRDSAAVVSLSPAAQAVRVLRQTYGDAAALAASPAYVNEVAYDRLTKASFLVALPFDPVLEECRGYLSQLGVPRLDLMVALSTTGKQTFSIAVESLGLSPQEGRLITTEDLTGQDSYWNTGNAADPASVLMNIQTFINTAGIQYTDLQQMLDSATSWLNPPLTHPQSSGAHVVGKMFIRHLDNTCTLAAKEIEGLENFKTPGKFASLDRFHRFIRLWRALVRSPTTGWSVSSVDRAIGAPLLGAGKLDSNCIVAITAISELTALLSTKSKTSVDDVVDLFAGFQVVAPDGVSPAPTTYTSLFLNVAAHGPINPAFKLQTISLNDSETPPSPVPRLSDPAYADYISTCLGATAKDLSSVIGSLTADAAFVDVLSVANLAKVWSVFSLSRRLGLSVDDYFHLVNFSGLKPLESISELLRFQEVVSKVLGLGFAVPDLQLLLRPPPSPPSSNDITDAKITSILTSIQAQYAEIQATNLSPFNGDLPAAENEAPTLDLISKIPGVSQTNLSQFKHMLEGSLNAADGAALVKSSLGPTLSADAVAAISKAQSDLAASPSDTNLQKTLAQVICDQLSAFSATVQRTKALSDALSSEFGLASDIQDSLLTGITSLASLRDPKLASGTVSRSTFPDQFDALRLLYRLVLVLSKFSLPATSVSWVLANADALGWANLAALPTSTSSTAIAWDAWLHLVDYVAVTAAKTFPAVQNPADKKSPFTLEGLLSQATSAGDVSPIISYFCSLASRDPTVVTALVTNFAFEPSSFKDVAAVASLQNAATAMRKVRLPVDTAVSLTAASGPTRDNTKAARVALNSLYPVDADWYGVLKGIQNRLRLRKRDALVSYLLAINKPRITSAQDLSELLLLDVEMGSETLTSRTIQAHQSVQQLVQRLLMGLEPTPLVDGDPFWAHWPEMSQYALWEANKKVFLYPEDWVDPALRDNKSELYIEIEELLKKQPITETSVENAIAAYLTSLDHIADLEVMTSFYDMPASTLHVFARTKGGSPREYFHRTLVLEATWSPWESLKNVNPVGDHLLAFFRSNRLTMVWPLFSYEQDPSQTSQPPAYPDINNMAGTSPDPISQRLVVKLAVCERNPDTGKWSQPVVTDDAVYWSGRYPTIPYLPAPEFPDNLEDTISLHYWDLGSNLGQVIAVCDNGFSSSEDTSDELYNRVFGVFTLTGCKGYPEPFVGPPTRNSLAFRILPTFKQTDYITERFVKSSSLSNNAPLDLAISTFLNPQSTSILNKEYGRFVITYPQQPTLVDWFLLGIQIYSMTRGSKQVANVPEMVSFYRLPTLPEGTFLPYFIKDSSTRGYVAIPGYESSTQGDTNFRTAWNSFDFFNKALQLALKYIAMYFNDPTVNKNIKVLRQKLNEDETYKQLKKEFLAVYVTVTTPWDVKLRTPRAIFASFYHPLVCFLRSQLYSGGTNLFMSRKTQLNMTDFDFNSAYKPTSYVRMPYPQEELEFDAMAPYADYNWELFFHLPFQIAVSFNSNMQFEQARNWYHYIFNPQGADMEDPDTGSGHASAPQKRYWQTKPFFKTQVADYIAQRIDSIFMASAADPAGTALANQLRTQIQLWRLNPFAPHVIARSRPVAYQLSIVMKYIQNLLDWGDSLFRQLTRETLTQASTLYTVAERLLGPKPQIVKPAVSVPPRTYNEFGTHVDLLGDALLDLENLVPDLGSLPHGGKELPQPPAPPLTTLYFGIPPNDSLMQLWDTVADRLFKIRHSLDIDGNAVSLALTAPPIDPGALVRALASGQSLAGFLQQFGSPLPHYRFRYIQEQAQAMASHVVDLGNQLLNLLERRDDEGLAQLRAGSEIKMLAAVRETKVQAGLQNESAVAALQSSKTLAKDRQSYYTELLNGKSPDAISDEMLVIMKNILAALLDPQIASGYTAAAVASMFPTFSVGGNGVGGSPLVSNPRNSHFNPESLMGELAIKAVDVVDLLGEAWESSNRSSPNELEPPWAVPNRVSASFGGGNVASAYSNGMSSLSTQRATLSTEAQNYAIIASYIRRRDEWTFQRDLATDEMAQIDAQIKAAQDQGTVLQKDLAAHDVQAAESALQQQYLVNKFTNAELFDWAATRVAATYSRAYNLAFATAQKAECCMAFELGDFSGAASNIIQYGRYDTLRSGLGAGADLLADLDRLAATYTDRNARELELTKHISLAQVAPEALLALRTSGSCLFALPEWLFDLDFPGHYFRRTRSIAVSIPCVAGPYTTVAATLRLQSGRFRALPTRAGSPAAYAESPPGGDDRFVYDVAPPCVAAATSTGVTDAGVFTLQLDGSDPRYLPFEHAGCIGSYALSLAPSEPFRYAAIADVVLTLNYTARDGGSALRAAAAPIPQTGAAALPLRTAFPAEWNSLVGAGRAIEPVLVAVPSGNGPGWMLPFWATARGRTPVVQQTLWCVVPASETASLDGVVLVVAGQQLALAQDPDGGNYWQATLPAKAVVLGKPVSIAWANSDDRNKIAEIVCIVSWNYTP